MQTNEAPPSNATQTQPINHPLSSTYPMSSNYLQNYQPNQTPFPPETNQHFRYGMTNTRPSSSTISQAPYAQSGHESYTNMLNSDLM